MIEQRPAEAARQLRQAAYFSSRLACMLICSICRTTQLLHGTARTGWRLRACMSMKAYSVACAQSTDTSFGEKLRQQLKAHACFGYDPRVPSLDFCVRHSPGDVLYSCDRCLAKNRDSLSPGAPRREPRLAQPHTLRVTAVRLRISLMRACAISSSGARLTDASGMKHALCHV